MSCIRFNTPAQRRQLAAMAPSMLTAEQVRARHPAPPLTDSKLERLRLLARDANPKIRASAASSRHAPVEVHAALAHDPDPEVRQWLARNETVGCELLRELARDDDETVRGFVALNHSVPEDVMATLAGDGSATVRALVAWKTRLRSEEPQEA
ncbi:MAG: hypothetical protein QM635_06675 [Microbacteriaceae bacterium]